MPMTPSADTTRVRESNRASHPEVLIETGAARSRFRTLMTMVAIAGLLLPWIFNLAYFASGGSIAPSVFWSDASANHLTTAITLDVYLAAIGFSIWVVHERRVRRPWLYVLLCFGIGLSFALPWYLAWRTTGST